MGMVMPVFHVLNISGGKDSTALLLWAMERGIDFQPVFADTGNEHPITLNYVRDLLRRTGCPEIKWVRADFSGDFFGRRKRIPEKWRRDGVPEERIQCALEALQPIGNPFLSLGLCSSGLYALYPRNKGRDPEYFTKVPGATCPYCSMGVTSQSGIKTLWSNIFSR